MFAAAQKALARFSQFSIGTQIGVTFAVFCIAFIVCASASAGFLAARQMTALIRQELSSSARALADQLNQVMAVRYQDVRALSRLKPIQHVWQQDSRTMREVLEDLQADYPLYSWVGFADENGKIISATKGMLEGASVAARPWFKNGLAGPAVEDVHDALLLEKLLGPKASGEPFRFVDIAFPVHDPQGRKLGVLGAHLSWDFAAALRQNMLNSARPEMPLEILILSSKGETLLGGALGSKPFDQKRIAQMMSEERGTFVAEGAQDTLVGFSTVNTRGEYPGLGWIVITRLPYAAALSPVHTMIGALVVLGAVLAAIGVLLCMLIARRIAKPLHDLTMEADRIGRDPATTVLSRHGGSEEVTKMSTALRALLRRLALSEYRTQSAEQRAADGAEQYAHDIQILRKMADYDPLTNLLNRRSFLSFANDAFEYFRRYGRGIATLMVDIDHFKKINDTYGHGAGDAVIKRVGELIEQCLRTTDKVGRFGGEEFVVLLREVDGEQARELANRIVKLIASQPMVYGTASIPVTVSIGITQATEGDRDIQDTIERSDKGLYMAKNTGRNRAFLQIPTGQVSRAA